jgi:hypothetical protein
VAEPGDICPRCHRHEVEVIDDWVSSVCGYCADRMYEREQERREWDYYHPSPFESR